MSLKPTILWNVICRTILYPIVFLFATCVWLLTTETGLKSLFWLTAQLTHHQLSATEIHGSLLGDIQLKNFEFKNADYLFQAKLLSMQFQIETLLHQHIKLSMFEIKEGILQLGGPLNSPLRITHAQGAFELQSNRLPIFINVKNLNGFWKNQPLSGKGGISLQNNQLTLFETFVKLGQTEFGIQLSPTQPNQLDWWFTLKPDHISAGSSSPIQARTKGYLIFNTQQKQWVGQISETTLQSTNSGTWTQNTPKKISFSTTHFAMEPLILQGSNRKSMAKIQVAWDAQKGLAATGTLSLYPGSFNLLLGNHERKIFYKGGHAEFSLNSKRFSSHFEFKENNQNTVQGEVNLSTLDFSRPLLEQALSGHITAHWNDLRFLYLLSPHIAKLTGSIGAHAQINGTVQHPKLTLVAKTDKIVFFIPKQKIKIRDLALSLSGDIPGTLQWNGSGYLSDSLFRLKGTSELEDNPKTSLSITGEALKIYNTPNIQIHASPDLTIDFVNHTLFVRGTVRIPQASIELSSNMKRTVLSNDVVFIGSENTETTKNVFRIVPNLYLILEKQVHFKGYGLDSFVSGKLEIDERPDGLLAGTGTLTTQNGKYRIQGSTRYIHQGRLLFPPGTLLNDPILDFLISQKRLEEFQDGTEVGLYIQGTLQKPLVEFHANADTKNAELLARLRTTGTEDIGSKQNQFSQPASLLAGGANPVIEKLQTNLGIEEFSVESRDTQKSIHTKGGTDTVLVVGKSLSQKLYLQFLQCVVEPVTTIRLKYFINPRITASVETGTEENIGGDLTFTMEKN